MDESSRRSLAAQGAVGLASFLTPFTYGALSVAMPTIGREFGFSAREMAMVMMVHVLFSTSFMLPVGRVSDYIGRKGLFMAGSVLFAISSFLAGMAVEPWQLWCARALQGVGDALTFGVSGAILVSIVPPERTGRAIGTNLTFVFVGLALGPLVGGALTSWLSWRVIFFASALAGVGAFALVRRGYREERERTVGRLPIRASLLFVLSMLGLILGISMQPSFGYAALGLASGVALWRLALAQEGMEHPIVDTAYVKGNRPFVLANVSSVLGFSAAFATSFLLSLYLQNVLGMKPDAAGYLLLVQPLTQALSSPFAGRLSDSMHPAKAASAGLLALGLGLLGVSSFGPDTGMAVVIAAQVLLGLGFSLFVSPNFNAIMGCVDPGHKGMASGFMTTMRGLGMSMSMSVTGIILAVWLGPGHTAGAGPEVLPALRACFALFGCVALMASWVSWRIVGERR